LNAGGPARALSTCHSEAARIAERVIAESGIKVGRTSQRLRNPRNLAPGWAQHFVADGNDRKAADARAMAVDLGNRVGVLRPISTATLCTNCHGPENALSQEVRERLRALYPDDRGVGFQPGDLRGWMWAEVPLKK
jgi:hypothetical protein